MVTPIKRSPFLTRCSGAGELRLTSAHASSMYVSQLTVDMGETGKKALEHLFKLGAKAGIIHDVGEFELV